MPEHRPGRGLLHVHKTRIAAQSCITTLVWKAPQTARAKNLQVLLMENRLDTNKWDVLHSEPEDMLHVHCKLESMGASWCIQIATSEDEQALDLWLTSGVVSLTKKTCGCNTPLWQESQPFPSPCRLGIWPGPTAKKRQQRLRVTVDYDKIKACGTCCQQRRSLIPIADMQHICWQRAKQPQVGAC